MSEARPRRNPPTPRRCCHFEREGFVCGFWRDVDGNVGGLVVRRKGGVGFVRGSFVVMVGR